MIRVRFAGIVAALAVPIAAAGTASAAPQARPSASMTPPPTYTVDVGSNPYAVA